jgi:signal transduction histidine kinase/ligand-binding sensor domain-containing protein
LSGSSTCRRPTAWGRRLTLVVVLACTAAHAVRAQTPEPSRSLSQYIRDRWSAESGFPGGAVHAITQTTDGYLWIGAEKGLFRFDGLSFRRFDPPTSMDVGRAILGVVGAPDGSLWARPRGVALFRFHKSVFRNILADAGPPESVASALVPGRRGSMLLATLGRGAVIHRDGRFESLVTAAAMPSSSFIVALAEASTGDVWLGTRDSGALRVRRGQLNRVSDGLPDLKVNCLLAGESDEMWVGTDRGVVRWDGTKITNAGIPAGLRGIATLHMIRDRQSAVWIAAGNGGLVRVSKDGRVESTARSGGTVGHVATVFEDRDGNIWVGTDRGLERWRDPVFTTFSVAQGMPAGSIGPVYADETGRVWFGPSTGGLFWIRNGIVTEAKAARLTDDVVYSIHGGGGEVWVGRQRGGVTRLRLSGDEIEATRFTHHDGLAQDSVFAIHRARDSAVWAGTLTGGVSRLKDGRFVTYDTRSGLPSNTVTSIIETSDRSTWFGTPNGLAAFSRNTWRTYVTKDGLPSNDILALFEDRAGVLWVGTANGMAVLQAGKMKAIGPVLPQLRGAILGFAEDAQQSLWLNMADRIIRVDRGSLLQGTLQERDVREYGLADGLLAVESVKRNGVVAADPRGRIWFSFIRGLSAADATRVQGRTPPALSAIEEVTADGAHIDSNVPVRIPSSHRRVAFTYNGLSLSVPERVRYRYRLDGFDSAWSDPTADRQAVYTNLAHGHYLFRVTASNSDGVWNGAEAILPFDIQPMVWQTAWFKTAALLLAAVAVWGVYRLRVRQVAGRLNAAFEDRLAERTRIAQELHDTLLQGFVSASMQLHVAADRLPEDSPERGSLDRVLQLMGRVIEEGRNAVRGLRSSISSSDDLAEAFAGIQKEVARSDTAFEVVVEGAHRPLNPLVRDEVYRIAREALVNAFHHANATRIELEIEYGSKELSVFVRDDGSGIDPGVIATGTEGHWGITGMRERAQRMRGFLKIRSRAGAGSEVELRIPAHIAFQRQRSGAGLTPLARFTRKAFNRSSVETTEKPS